MNTEANTTGARFLTGRRSLALGLSCGLMLGWLVALGCASTRKEPDLQLMTQAWNTIQKRYVDRGALQPQELTYGAISGTFIGTAAAGAVLSYRMATGSTTTTTTATPVTNFQPTNGVVGLVIFKK